jgi:stearoyl-CoA desaturase (Delta-9 desaturase)
VWQQRTRGAQELLSALRAWCERAEQSGNEALGDFAEYLRSYSLAGTAA